MLWSALTCCGGTGDTLPLCVMCLRSKSEQLRAVGKAGIIPGIFNINEPITFGVPIMYNPIMAIPYILTPLVSALVFYPLFIVLFGLNRWPLIAIGFIFAVVAMMLNTLHGFEQVPRVLRRAARAMRLSPMQTLRHVTLPACAPHLFNGLKLAIVYSFIGVIAGEFVLSGAGLGHRISFAYNNFDNATMYGLMLLLLAFVGALNLLLYGWERRIDLRRGGR